jgi:peptidoglycan/LPS O-acetylase OafA/YrhL
MGFATMADRTAAADTTAPHDSLKHIASLDGVRGVAISFVLLFHLLGSNTQTSSRGLNLIAGLRGAGWIGVDLFFALSGFLITGILFDTLATGHYFKNFYARRFLRIFPLYYGVLFVLFLIPSIRMHEGRAFFLLFTYLQNTPLWLHGSQAEIARLTDHLWSLAVEEQFYLVWPVLIFLIRDRRRLMWTAVVLGLMAPAVRLVLLAHGASFQETYKLTICRADSLLAGAWLALAVRGKLRETVLRYAAPVFGISVFLCGMIAWRTGNFTWDRNHSINAYGYSILAVASISLIAMALRPNSMTARVMRVGILRFLGKYSYGIYVYHQIVFTLVDPLFSDFLHDHIPSKGLYHAVLMVSVLLITIPLAVVSFHCFEQPFLKLKRYFNYPPSPPSAPKEQPRRMEPQGGRDAAGSPALR